MCLGLHAHTHRPSVVWFDGRNRCTNGSQERGFQTTNTRRYGTNDRQCFKTPARDAKNSGPRLEQLFLPDYGFPRSSNLPCASLSQAALRTKRTDVSIPRLKTKASPAAAAEAPPVSWLAAMSNARIILNLDKSQVGRQIRGVNERTNLKIRRFHRHSLLFGGESDPILQAI